MSINLDTLEQLLIGDEGLLLSLRLGDGLQKNKVDKIINVLEHLALDWSKDNVIPKKAVDLFIDIFPVMQAASLLYSNDEEVEIMDAADKIMNSIRNCIVD